MAQYHHLSLMEREELSRQLAAGASLRATAQFMEHAPANSIRGLRAMRERVLPGSS